MLWLGKRRNTKHKSMPPYADFKKKRSSVTDKQLLEAQEDVRGFELNNNPILLKQYADLLKTLIKLVIR